MRRVRARAAFGALWVSAVVSLGAAPVWGQAGVEYARAPAAGEWSAEVAAARALVDSLMRTNNIPGLSIAVSVDGRTVWSEGFGYADVEQQTPVTPATRFRIGSISKPLTAAAVAQLVEQGKLDLDAPVQRYVPSFPEKPQGTVTTRLLAGHLAGVRHYRGDEFLLNRRFATVLEALEIFRDDSLIAAPGTRYSYSSYGWNLISAVVENASGERFLDYMRAHVFEPLGMRHTVADHVDSIIVGRTGYYQRTRDSAIVNAPAVDNSYKWAGGGFLSTPDDLLRFAHAHLDGGFLTPETVRLLWTSQRTEGGEESGYGIGWSVGTDGQERRVVSHGGGSVGGNSLLLIYPDQRVVLAVTANISGAGYRNVPVRIAGMFMN